MGRMGFGLGRRVGPQEAEFEAKREEEAKAKISGRVVQGVASSLARHRRRDALHWRTRVPLEGTALASPVSASLRPSVPGKCSHFLSNNPTQHSAILTNPPNTV